MMDWDAISEELNRPLDKAHVKPPKKFGPKGDYIEGWWAISEANRIFGFGGWTHEILELTVVSERARPIGEAKKDGFGVSYRCRVRVSVDTVSRDGVGVGHGYDLDCGLAHESAAKEAETDALKRALVKFGNPFGLALYDKTQANVEDSAARLKVEKRAAEIQRQIKNIADAGEYAGFANSIRNEVRDMGVNGFAELAAQISAAMVTKKDELTEKKDAS